MAGRAKSGKDSGDVRAQHQGLAARFWGVRGSAPQCGAGHLAFGGATMCIEVTAGARRLVIDAGSGIRDLGWALCREDVGEIDLLLTHYHLDHLLGLWSFSPLFRSGTRVVVHAPILETGEPTEILRRLFDAPYSPLRPEDAGASLVVRPFQPGASFEVAGFEARTTPLTHPGGACGYRLGWRDSSLALVFDHEHGGGTPEPWLAAFCAGADVILYDAHWDEDVDYAEHRGWGHSTWQAGLRLLEAAKGGSLGLLHHAPDATDAVLTEREGRLRRQHAAGFFARQGEAVRIGRQPAAAQASSGSERLIARTMAPSSAAATPRMQAVQPKPSKRAPSAAVPASPPQK
jgi:phosphoribosyl 1,2-cyclic phosphodiesterase